MLERGVEGGGKPKREVAVVQKDSNVEGKKENFIFSGAGLPRRATAPTRQPSHPEVPLKRSRALIASRR